MHLKWILRHRLKVAMPIIPFILDYEGELELGTGDKSQRSFETIYGAAYRRVNRGAAPAT